ncbi:hypothetical protein R1sor_002612 [Riccia sorocarpa]|uniref:Uncharacterized protein n=1 Tax=Riccia sorocarpa TaxID=122646 RepID=A0ABD3H2H1_9MARC
MRAPIGALSSTNCGLVYRRLPCGRAGGEASEFKEVGRNEAHSSQYNPSAGSHPKEGDNSEGQLHTALVSDFSILPRHQIRTNSTKPIILSPMLGRLLLLMTIYTEPDDQGCKAKCLLASLSETGKCMYESRRPIKSAKVLLDRTAASSRVCLLRILGRKQKRMRYRVELFLRRTSYSAPHQVDASPKHKLGLRWLAGFPRGRTKRKWEERRMQPRGSGRTDKSRETARTAVAGALPLLTDRTSLPLRCAGVAGGKAKDDAVLTSRSAHTEIE